MPFAMRSALGPLFVAAMIADVWATESEGFYAGQGTTQGQASFAGTDCGELVGAFPYCKFIHYRATIYAAANKMLRSDLLGVPISLVTPAFIVSVILLCLWLYTPALGTETKRSQNVIVSKNAELIGQPAILSLGTAVPGNKVDIAGFREMLNWVPGPSTESRSFWTDRLDSSGIERRHFCFDHSDMNNVFRKSEIPGNPNPEERFAYWNEWAPKLAIEAAKRAVENWNGNKREITHVIFHSCTGFRNPGVEFDVIDSLDLTGVKSRLAINFVGCHGGFKALSVAKAYADSDPDAVILVICAEISSAHFSVSEKRSSNIGNVVFADGASAAIIGKARVGDWVIGEQVSRTLGKDTRDKMTWTPSNRGYELHLDKGIARALGIFFWKTGRSLIKSVCPSMRQADDVEWCLHPGGRKILDLFCSSSSPLGCSEEALRHSYETLKHYGNMESGTIFFVIQHMMEEAKRKGSTTRSSAVCLGFGPGLSVEILGLHRVG